jgi:S-formylglutathione hydrolase FrmB
MFSKLRRLLSRNQPPVAADDALARQRAAEENDRLLSQWQSALVDGRNVETFVPADTVEPAGAVLFLHGHGGIRLADNLVFSRLFQQNGLIAVCPEGGRSWWLDVASPEFPEGVTPQRWLCDSVVPFIGSQFCITSPRIALLGVSMGGQGVLQLAYRHASQFPVVSAIAPAVDFQQLWGNGIPLDVMFTDAEQARQETVVLNLHPLSWPRHQFYCCDPADTDWFDGAARLGMKLSSSGVMHDRDLETSAGGHSWEYFNHMGPAAIQNIVQGLEQQSAL